MIYPDFLSKNGNMCFVAPSYGCATEPYKSAFDNAIANLKEKGYHLTVGANCYSAEGIGISSSPRKCANELMAAFLNSENEAILSVGGGELMCEILPFVDFESVKKASPKWFMGYSDNTNITFLLPTLCDIASIYGPNASAFGMEPWHKSLFDALEVLSGNRTVVNGYAKWEKESLKSASNPYAPYNVTENTVLRKYIGRELIPATDEKTILNFSGRLIGGCLDVLSNLVGTPFDKVNEFAKKYEDDGFIWCLESCDLNVYGIRRAMWQLYMAGWFKNVNGFIIGRPLCINQEIDGLKEYGAFLEIAGKLHVPVIMDCDMGHLPPAMPLVMGSFANVTVKENDIKLDMHFI